MPRTTEPLEDVVEARANGHANPLEDKDWVRDNEKGLLDALLGAARTVTWQPVAIPRVALPDGSSLVLTVRGLHHDELERCRKQAVRKAPRARFGQAAQADDVDNSKLAALTILAASHDKDHAAIWDNRALYAGLHVALKEDLVHAVLLAGEVARVSEVVMELSGILDSSEQEAAKSVS